MGSEVERTNPFQAVQGIVSDIICEKLGLSKVDDINYQNREVERIFKQPTDRIICSIIVPQLAPTFQLKGLGLSNKKIYEELHRIVIDLLATRPPSLIVIDDAQWIDKMSWNLIEDILKKSKSQGNIIAGRHSRRMGSEPNSKASPSSPSSELRSVRFNKFQHIIAVVSRPPDEQEDVIATFLEWLDANEKDRNIDPVLRMNLGTMDNGSLAEIIAQEIGVHADRVDKAILDVVTNAAAGNPSHAKIFVSWIKEKNIAIEDKEGHWKLKSAAVEIKVSDSESRRTSQ